MWTVEAFKELYEEKKKENDSMNKDYDRILELENNELVKEYMKLRKLKGIENESYILYKKSRITDKQTVFSCLPERFDFGSNIYLFLGYTHQKFCDGTFCVYRNIAKRYVDDNNIEILENDSNRYEESKTIIKFVDNKYQDYDKHIDYDDELTYSYIREILDGGNDESFIKKLRMNKDKYMVASIKEAR